MTEFLYQALEKIGYTHPVHPPLTHIPMGLVFGAFIFALIALLFRRTILPVLAYNRIILLALIFSFPTILFGYTDWQHFYEGAWLFPIKIKLALSGILVILLSIALIVGRKAKAETKGTLAIYTLCFLTVIVLGYFGGQLVFEGEGRPLTVPMRFMAGEKLFATHCNDCHPHGEDILDAYPLSDFSTFRAYLRNPQGGMPPFPAEKISDAQAMKLYQYITKVLEKSKTSRN
jgi:uncharacterized membrane protein